MKTRRFVVSDRDGTIIVEREYLSNPSQIELIPGAARGLRQLRGMGFGLIMITNQSGISRGFFDQAQLTLIHERLGDLLLLQGVHLDGIYVCPHRPEEKCSCRKPRTGLLELASRELNFTPQDCFVIGDKACDVELGQRVEATTFLVRTGYGAQLANETTITPDYIVDDVLDAAQVIQQLLSSHWKVKTNMQGDEHFRNRVRNHLLESAEIKRRLIEECTNSIIATASLLVETFGSGGKVLLCGNGGSAADCQHMAAEFVNRLSIDISHPGLPAIALTTDTSFLTAYANDSGFGGVFERQVQALGKPGDLLIGISTSGTSRNVIRAIEAARVANMQTVVLTGSRGKLAKMADVAITVPSKNTLYIQEAHLAIEHILCDLVERSLYGEGDGREGKSRLTGVIREWISSAFMRNYSTKR